MTAADETVACSTCRALFARLAPLETAGRPDARAFRREAWALIAETYATREGSARCRACGRLALVFRFGDVTVKRAEDRACASDAIPTLDCPRCDGLVSWSWARIREGTLEVPGGDPGRTHGPAFACDGPSTFLVRSRHRCVDCGRVIEAIDEPRAGSWHAVVPIARPGTP